MLRIGSLYGHGFDREQLTELAAMGFALRPQTALYAGSQVCRFLDFPIGPALEFIEVTDTADYEAFVPAGMAPYCPGISLLVDEGSPAALDDYARAFAAHDPYRLRVPYRTGDRPGSPGWHYLNLARPLVPGTFIWLTAFDQPKPVTERNTQHPNGVLGVIGLLLDLPPEALAGLSHLVGQPIVDGALRIGDVTIWATGTDRPGGKQFPLRAVVLHAADLATVRAHARTASETRLMGAPALRIPTNPLAWELLITTTPVDAATHA